MIQQQIARSVRQQRRDHIRELLARVDQAESERDSAAEELARKEDGLALAQAELDAFLSGGTVVTGLPPHTAPADGATQNVAQIPACGFCGHYPCVCPPRPGPSPHNSEEPVEKPFREGTSESRP